MDAASQSYLSWIRGRVAVWYPLLAVLFALAAAWFVIFLVIPPRLQNFPVIDDWSFTRLADRVAHGEGFSYDGWPSMPLIGQCLCAVPYIWMFGESFVVMRFVTLVLTGLATVALFDLLRSEPGVSARSAAFGTAAMAFNPFFFTMSGTFMTDVPALSFSIISLALVCRGAGSARVAPIMAGGVAALLATTTRQNAIAAPLAMALFPAKNRIARSKLCVVAATTLLAGLVTAAWFANQPQVNVRPILLPTSQRLTDLLLRHGQVLGLSAIPVLLLRPRRLISPGFLFWLAFFGCWTWGWVYFNYQWYKQPYLQHIQPHPGDAIKASGLYFHETWTPWTGVVTRISLTVIGCFGLAGLMAGPGFRARIGSAGRVLLGYTALHIVLMSMIDPVYDRYMIVLLPAVVMRTIPRRLPLASGRPRWWVGLTAMGLLASGSIALTHDWFSFNAARWELGRRALARGVDPLDIDGGLEWNGWYATKIRKPTMVETPPKNLTIGFTRDIFPNVRGLYTFDIEGWGWGLPPNLRPSTSVVDSISYSLWLSPHPGRMDLVKAK